MEAIRGPAEHDIQLSERPPPPPLETDGEAEEAVVQQCRDEWQHRRWFVVKAMAVALLQVVFTAAVYRLFRNIGPLKDFAFLHYKFLSLIFWGFGLSAYLGLWVNSTIRRKHPWNLAALLIGTLGIAVGIGITCAAVAIADASGELVDYIAAHERTTAYGAACSFVLACFVPAPVEVLKWTRTLGVFAVVVGNWVPEDTKNPQSGWETAAVGFAAFCMLFALVDSFQAILGYGPWGELPRQPLDNEDWAQGAVQIYLDIIFIHFGLTPIFIWLNFDAWNQG